MPIPAALPKLIGMPPTSPFQLRKLTSAVRPFKLHYFDSLPSTNDRAAEMRRSGELFAPAIVLTANQTAGRGRGTNRWFSSSACITVTCVMPVEETLEPHQLPLVAGLAVRNAASELTGREDITMKWPNDVLYHGSKLAGLLCERVSGVDLVGIGLNVNLQPGELPDALQYSATSIAKIAGRSFDLTDVLISVSRHLNVMLLTRQSHTFATFLEQYRQHDSLLGQTLTITNGDDAPITGTCEGIDADGRLLVRTSKRLHRIIAGSVTADPGL